VAKACRSAVAAMLRGACIACPAGYPKKTGAANRVACLVLHHCKS